MTVHALVGSLYTEPTLSTDKVLDDVRLFLESFAFAGQRLVPDPVYGRLLEKGDATAFAEAGNLVRAEPENDLSRRTAFIFHQAQERSYARLEVMPSPSKQAVEPNWPFLVAALEQLALIVHPIHGAANGITHKHGERVYPPLDDILAPAFPATLTPWTYLGPHRLTPEIREQLAVLDAFRSEPLGEGWVVQSVEHYHDTPSPRFLAQVKNYLHAR